MWKFHDFSIIQNLREINFENSRSANSNILTHLEAVKHDFIEFLQFFRLKCTKKTNFRAPKIAQSNSFTSSRFSKNDFTSNISDLKILKLPQFVLFTV